MTDFSVGLAIAFLAMIWWELVLLNMKFKQCMERRHDSC